MSAPCKSGFCRHGESIVLSSASSALRTWTLPTSSAMSEIRRKGFVGDSSGARFVFAGKTMNTWRRIGLSKIAHCTE
jgi:hypothetical protein